MRHELQPELQSHYFFIILEQMKTRTYLSQVELMVMLAILRLRDDAYGVSIAQEILDRTGNELAIGVIYSTLGRLEDEQLVHSEVGEATAERGGRAKTYFRLTAHGLRRVKETQRSLQQLWEAIPQLRAKPI